MKKSYKLEVRTQSDPNPIADGLVASFPEAVEASGVGPGVAFIRFRVENDDEALLIASEIMGTWDHQVTTGYGVHRRVVRDYSQS